ncbi:MAG: GrpB family protein [Chloroflexi bacterium]|nr:GrpB family protein [Chloroflexota bacterium]
MEARCSEEYASLKRRLTAEYQTDRIGYSKAKTDFTLSTLNQASS